MTRSADRRVRLPQFVRVAFAAFAVTALGLISLTAVVPPAHASGHLTGHVQDQAGNAVLGLPFEVVTLPDGNPVTSGSTDLTTGDFDVALPDGDYIFAVDSHAVDHGGVEYGQHLTDFSISGADADFGTVVVDKYVEVTGTITNWTSSMGDVQVQLQRNPGSGWGTIVNTVSTDGTFTVPTTLANGSSYTLYFGLSPASTVPFLSAFLGGELFDVDNAAVLPTSPGVSISGVLMAMPDAALISGTVTDAVTGLGIPNISVSAEDHPGALFYAQGWTDAHGDYSLRVVPGLTYAVSADDPRTTYGSYVSMTYDGFDACGCDHTPVQTTVLLPATGIDFHLQVDTDVNVLGVVLNGALSSGPSGPYEGVQVHVYRHVPGGWSEVASALSDHLGQFEVALPGFGSYRLRFELAGVWLPVLDGLLGQGSATAPTPATPGCFVDTGALGASSVENSVGFFVVAGLDQAGGCAAEPAPLGSTGHGSSGHGRAHPASVLVDSTPTATPTPTLTPSPSASPSDDATPTPQPSSPATTSTSLDLSWLWIVIAFVRRRRP